MHFCTELNSFDVKWTNIFYATVHVSWIKCSTFHNEILSILRVNASHSRPKSIIFPDKMWHILWIRKHISWENIVSWQKMTTITFTSRVIYSISENKVAWYATLFSDLTHGAPGHKVPPPLKFHKSISWMCASKCNIGAHSQNRSLFRSINFVFAISIFASILVSAWFFSTKFFPEISFIIC